MGIDAIWVPPSYKNGSTGSTGYSPFDHYDLGDKYQKGGSDSLTVRTRLGNKDELLRMIAVMHANGIEVLQDVVLNHVDQAGNNSTGAGGKDFQSPFSVANADGFKNFRYTSYATPLIDDSQNDYWTRGGRWSKNYTNFYPNQNNNCTTGDICAPLFGPDISYEGSAFGQSSNIPTSGTALIAGTTRPFTNAPQTSDYMRNNARNWIMWYKKQTGVDGWRWDAVKHFPIYAQEDFIYNTKYVLPDFAKGGQTMFNIGEWIGGKEDLDKYVSDVRSGAEEHTGTFDFSLRGYGPNGGLYSMVTGLGAYNMQLLPGEQQEKRFYDYSGVRVHRTCPFVNSHDTYRPFVDANGNFRKGLGDPTGWNLSQELGGNGQHIDPREPRLFSAYATVFAMDGNPTVFFEDLFDIGTTGKRFTHQPTSTTDLPVRQDIVNIIQAHQKLQFKNGNYAVPTALTGTTAPFYLKGSSNDHIVFERTGKALIGVTDKFNTTSNNSQDEEVWVSTSDPAWRNVDLYDYSGAHGLTTTRVQADGRVLVKTAPVAHTIAGANGHGYSIWAPKPAGVNFTSINDLYNYLSTYVPARNEQTTQEWEMADDLGDSHVKSLQQGGQLPANSTAQRTVGKIYVHAGKPVKYLLYPSINGLSQQITLYNADNTIASQVTGSSSSSAPLSGNYMPSTTAWLTIKVKNSTAAQAAQRVWVNVTYTAPKTIDTRASGGKNSELSAEKLGIVAYPNPARNNVFFGTQGRAVNANFSLKVLSFSGQEMLLLNGDLMKIQNQFNRKFSNFKSGVYFLQFQSADMTKSIRLVKIK
jgi:alpha-amylase